MRCEKKECPCSDSTQCTDLRRFIEFACPRGDSFKHRGSWVREILNLMLHKIEALENKSE